MQKTTRHSFIKNELLTALFAHFPKEKRIDVKNKQTLMTILYEESRQEINADFFANYPFTIEQGMPSSRALSHSIDELTRRDLIMTEGPHANYFWLTKGINVMFSTSIAPLLDEEQLHMLAEMAARVQARLLSA